MKKLIVAMLTALALVAGPGLVASSASADDYVPVTPTKCLGHVVHHGHFAQHQRPRIKFGVRAPGNVEPHGIVFIVVRTGSGHVVTILQRQYHANASIAYILPKLRGTKHGKVYKATFQFVGHGFQNQKKTLRFLVTR